MKKRHYYAISYPCGVAINANTGDRYGQYYCFDSKSARDEWVEGGGEFRSSPNWREPIPSKDAELRRYLRLDEEWRSHV